MNFREYITASLAVITLVGVAIGRYPALKMNRATIAMVGATGMVAFGALSLEQAYAAIDWNTVILLFGMMVLNVNLRMAGFFQLVTSHVVRIARTPRQLLALTIAVSGFFSAIFLNDTIVLVFTPLILDVTLALKRNPLPYLVALVTAANIGSVGTITGNPQNMLVGISSGIGFADFTRSLAPVGMAGLVVAWIVLVVVYRTEFRSEKLRAEASVDTSVQPSLLRKSLLASAVLIVALVAGVAVPLSAAIAASLLMITRRTEPERVFQDIDWGLLVFFSSLFVVTGAIASSGLGRLLFDALAPLMDGGPLPLTAASVVLSNLVSNVPAVMLFRPIVPTLGEPHTAWLTLAMATTLAGNLTLLGSVANLIVAEIAGKRGVQLSFVEYLKAGTAIAVLTLAIGVAWLSL
ncbi:MAG: anion transporter [Opitutaceae bacterium]|nr:anion transporter [Opitutaceae bacterium]